MLFIHDHTFVSKDGKYYTTGSLNQKVMDRYKSWFGNCSVFATTRKAQEKDSAFIKEENKVEGIDFKLVSKKNSIKHLINICKPMENAVKESDCIVVRMSIFGAIGIHYARKYNIPYMVEMVACPWDSLWYHSIKGKILAPFMTALTKKVCKQAKYVLYVTNKFLQKRYPSYGKQVGCSDVELLDIDSEVYKKRLDKIKRTDLKGKTLKLCTVANIEVRYKGQEIVIRSLKKLSEKGINCEYYLIGGGDSTRIKKIIKEEGVENKVHIIGPVPHEKVFDYIDKIDIYVQPSNQEGLPRAVIEAMSRGCPIIGSSTGGIPELINSNMVFKKGSVNAFCKVMDRLTNEKLYKCAKQNYQKSFEYEKEYLDKKRSNFYMDFASCVKKEKM